MLTSVHQQILESCAIDPDLATTCGVYSVTREDQLPPELASYKSYGLGIAFPWKDYITGEVTHQIRLDQELSTGQKYIWPKGVQQKLGLLHGGDDKSPVLLIEGYKQSLAVLSTLGVDNPYTILAMAGCYGTSTVDTSDLEDREVIVLLDADVRKKTGVWEAAEGIGHQLSSVGCTVKFIVAPGTGSQGIDDILGDRKRLSTRKRLLDRLIEDASMALPSKPGSVTPISAAPSASQSTGPSRYFDPNTREFQAVQLANEHLVPVVAQFDNDHGPMRRYKDGVYSFFNHAEQLGPMLAGLLGNKYKVAHRAPVWDHLKNQIEFEGFYPPEFMTTPWLNTPTGMINLRTGEYADHDPSFYSCFQIGTNYDPTATCPRFDAWLEDMCGNQGPALLEYFAQCLDSSRVPAKHILLEGPPGSGKSTMIRIFQSVISGQLSGTSKFCSALTMKQLNAGGFQTVNLLGSVFNAAGELEASEIKDITEFKLLTGEDMLTVDVKNAGHVTFKPRALFCFAMNEFPKVKDSEPYFRRVTPFRFENQKGFSKPDPSIEEHIRSQELSGILNRLIAARQDTLNRGHLPPADMSVLIRFKTSTNPVLAWFYSDENLWADEWVPTAKAYGAYQAYCAGSGLEYEARGRFTAALKAGVPGVLDERKYLDGKQVRALYIPSNGLVKAKGNDDPDDDGGSPPPAPEPDPSPVPPAPVEQGEEVTDQDNVVEPVVEDVRVSDTEYKGHMLTFDMETDSVSRFWDTDPVDYIKLIGLKVRGGDTWTTYDLVDAVPYINGYDILVGQNVIDFDLLALHRAGRYDLEDVITGKQLVIDTMILARQLDPPSARQSKAARPYSLRNLAEKHDIPINKDVLKQLAKQYDTSGLSITDPGFTGFGEIPVDEPQYVEYLKDDVEVTEKVLEAEAGPNLEKLIDFSFVPKPGGMIDYLRREHKIAAIAAKSRWHGLRVDRALLEERVSNLDLRRAALLSTLQTEYGLPKEGKAPQSSDAGKAAIRAALLDMGMGEEEQPLTDGGAYSFSGESMQKIVERNPGNQQLKELCEVVAELNGQRTVYHTVLDNLKADGKVHPEIDFRQATGRWSITKPGLTVMGKRGVNATERQIFIPSEGHVFVSADFAQVDARCVAAHSQDEVYLELFQGGRDLHTEVAMAVFHDASKRQLAKAVGHGWNYGGSPKALAASSGAELSDVEAFDRAARAQFIGVVNWQDEVRAQAMRGEFLNNGWGRRLFCDPNRAYTQAPALIGQSCARDIMCEALLRMAPEVRDCLRVAIHDEFLMEFPEDRVKEYSEELVRAMTFEWRGVPFMGDTSAPAKSWYGVYEH